MLDDALAEALSDPAALLQLVVLLMVLLTVAVAALTAIITVHIALRQREAAADAAALPLPAPRTIPAQMIPAQIVAVISAAAYAVVGSHRLIHIGEWSPGSGWATEVRQRLHTSHSPHD
jgi:heme/copper-type cytochrome/quinol oxidase subunit 2